MGGLFRNFLGVNNILQNGKQNYEQKDTLPIAIVEHRIIRFLADDKKAERDPTYLFSL